MIIIHKQCAEGVCSGAQVKMVDAREKRVNNLTFNNNRKQMNYRANESRVKLA